MADGTAGRLISEEDIAIFHKDGYVIVRNLLSPQESNQLLNNFMEMLALGSIPDCFAALPLEEALAAGDILQAYPRLMHPHKVNAMAMGYLLDARIVGILTHLLGEEPIAMQSMVYFKPPGAKGQALHQDNFYLKVQPGTCIAAWVALEAADEENGGLVLVPNSHTGEIQCPHEADPLLSFTREEVDVPGGLALAPVHLQAGDVLFFNGNVIHGSYPNRSKDRFRRALITHYAPSSAQKISKLYYPFYKIDGTVVEREPNESNGPCGNEFAAASPH